MLNYEQLRGLESQYTSTDAPMPQLATGRNEAVEKFYQAPMNLGRSAPLGAMASGQASAQVDAEEMKKAHTERMRAWNESQKDRVRREDTPDGYKFYDGQGNEISAYQFARAKGVNLRTALGETTNQEDVGALNEYELIRQAMELASQASTDIGARAEYQLLTSMNPQLKGNAADLMRQLIKKYPRIFTLRYE